MTPRATEAASTTIMDRVPIRPAPAACEIRRMTSVYPYQPRLPPAPFRFARRDEAAAGADDHVTGCCP